MNEKNNFISKSVNIPEHLVNPYSEKGKIRRVPCWGSLLDPRLSQTVSGKMKENFECKPF